MMPHSLDGGSQVLWEDGERVFRRGWQLDNHGKRRAVLLVMPAADQPSGHGPLGRRLGRICRDLPAFAGAPSARTANQQSNAENDNTAGRFSPRSSRVARANSEQS